MTKTKKNLLFLILWLLVLVLIILFSNGTLYKLYREVEFYFVDHTEAELAVKAYAQKHSVFYSDYPESLIDLLERNPEAEQFVLEYPLYEKTPYDLSEYADSDTVPLFLQWDQRWGYETYGSDCIGITGCGPTCLAMVGYHLTGDSQFDPAQIARFAEESGYYAPGYGSSWTLISQGGVELGLDVTELPLDEGVMEKHLKSGTPIICAMGPGHFTTAGHYIVLTGLEDGQFTVNDPNSRLNSEKLWSYDDISGQIRNLWAIQKAN